MKNLKRSTFVLSILIASLAVTGCGGYDPNNCYESVKRAYPNAEVVMIPGEDYRFIVKEVNGDVIYVETMNMSNGDVTQAFTAIRGGS